MTDQYISPQALLEQLKTEQPPFVVDVRGLDEFTAGRIPGAHHIPLDEMDERLGEIPQERAIVPY